MQIGKRASRIIIQPYAFYIVGFVTAGSTVSFSLSMATACISVFFTSFAGFSSKSQVSR
jgi:hypothetical protein